MRAGRIARSVPRRALLGLAALSTSALPACAIVLGVQDDPTNAVTSLCGCPAVSKAVTDCEQTLENRLELATSEVRAAWLLNYANGNCSVCPNVSHCFYVAPTCVASGNACTSDEECCSWTLLTPLRCDRFHGSVCK